MMSLKKNKCISFSKMNSSVPVIKTVCEKILEVLEENYFFLRENNSGIVFAL